MLIKIKNRVLIVFMLVFGCLNLNATEYTISSAKELTDLSLVAGDVVVMQNGTWLNQEIVFKGVGTESQPITLKAETASKVILSGSSKLKMSGEYLVVEGLIFAEGALSSDAIISFRTSSSELANNCRLTNTKIINYNPASKDTDYKWVSLYGAYNRVDHCHFEGKQHSGTVLVVWLENGIVNHHTIDHNYFGPRPDLGYNGGEIIRIGTSDYSMNDSYTTVEHNVFERCDGEIEIISNKSCYNTYRYNTFISCQGTLTLRHGNNCEVYSNFFFGNKKPECGGIRIIGENHKVYNNYLQDLTDDGFRAAISLTNGVPDSPLNRYFQVKNAEVVNNTIVNCKYPISIGSGADSELSLPPVDCKIANNVVAIYTGVAEDIIEYVDEPINLTYQNNMFYGADLGIDQPTGIELTDPQLELADNLYRPLVSSPVIAYGTMDFDYMTFDMDGQSRTTTNDAGADQVSEEPIKIKPLEKSDVGVSWANSLKEVSTAEGGQKLIEYINTANDGDEIVLTTSGGIYKVDTSAVLKAQVKIRALSGLTVAPVIKASAEVNEFVRIEQGGDLNVCDLSFEGGSNSSTALMSAFTVAPNLGQVTSTVYIDNCIFNNFTHSNGGNIVNIKGGTSIAAFTVSNTQTYNVGSKAYNFEANAVSENITLTNCTFKNVAGEILFINTDEQGKATIEIDHCTIDSVGFSANASGIFSVVNANTTISNNIVSYSPLQPAISITGAVSSANYNMFWQSGGIETSNGAQVGTNNWMDTDPMFAVREQLIYSLLPASPALASGSDGLNLGDLFWDVRNGQPNNNALLRSILVDGVALEAFDPYTFNYEQIVNDSLNYAIKALAQDTDASIKTTYPESIPGKVTIEVVAENGINTYLYAINIMPTVGVHKELNTSFSVYPNPGNGQFIIESNSTGIVKVYNSVGRLLFNHELTIGFNHINMTSYANGIYIYSFETDSVVKTMRIIKQ